MRCTKRVCGKITLHLGTLGILCLAAGFAGATPSPQQFVTDELLVQFKAGVHKSSSDRDLSAAGTAEAEEIAPIQVKRIKVPAAAREKVKAALARNPHVSFVEENYLAKPTAIPNDPSYASQWHLPKIAAPPGWDISTGSSTVDIAIIDTGVDPSHPDLTGKLLPGYNFVTNTTDTHDVYGHGTKTAGSAAAMANNGVGVSGVAWQNPIMPLVVTDSTGSASYSSIANAITYAVDHGVRIINISFGGPTSSTTLQSAIDYAWNKGAVVFASAGNYATSTPNYPAACNHVVAVSATTSSDTLASFSSFGSWITVAAPGDAILTTTNGGGYGTVSGTSFSSPITAGLGALILSVNPTLTNAQVVDIITKNADDLGAPGFDTSFGNGRINVFKSLSAAKIAVPVTDTLPPTVSISSLNFGSTVKGTVTINAAASDNVGVSRVELYINGVLYASSNVSPFSFSWDTTTLPDSIYSIAVKAYDAAGNVGQWSLSGIIVNNSLDTIAPTVSITAPTNGTTLGAKTTVSISAKDNLAVQKIELYFDGTLLTTASGTNTLTYYWNTRKVAGGSHTILAKAFDFAGNVGTTTITVTK